MILIEQKKAVKLPGYTSLFVSFNYNQQIVSFVKNIENSLYNPKIKTWQIPLCELKKLLVFLSKYDDIQLTLEKDKKQIEDKKYELSKYKMVDVMAIIEKEEFGGSLTSEDIMTLSGYLNDIQYSVYAGLTHRERFRMRYIMNVI